MEQKKEWKKNEIEGVKLSKQNIVIVSKNKSNPFIISKIAFYNIKLVF